MPEVLKKLKINTIFKYHRVQISIFHLGYVRSIDDNQFRIQFP